MHLSDLISWFYPELGNQIAAKLPENLQRLSPPPTDTECAHVLRMQSLVQWIFDGERSELGQHFPVHPEPNLGFRNECENSEPGLVQLAAFGFEYPLTLDVDQCGSAPQPQRLIQDRSPAAVVTAGDQFPTLENQRIVFPIIDVDVFQQVSAGSGYKYFVRNIGDRTIDESGQILPEIEDVRL